MKKKFIMLINVVACLIILFSVTAVEQVNATSNKENKIVEQIMLSKKTIVSKERVLAELNTVIKKLSERNSDESFSAFKDNFLSGYDPVKPCLIPLLVLLSPILIPLLVLLAPILGPLLTLLAPILGPLLVLLSPIGLSKINLLRTIKLLD